MFHQEIQKDRSVKADLTEVQTAAGLADDVLLSPRQTRGGRSQGGVWDQETTDLFWGQLLSGFPLGNGDL